MPFKPGHKKIGGRKKGTPNKKTQALQEILEAKGFDVVDRLCAIIEGGHLLPKEQAWILVELMSYIYPKRKAVEVDGEVDLNQREIIYTTEWDNGGGSGSAED